MDKKEEIKLRNKEYYQRNKEKIREKERQRYWENREARLAAQKVRGEKYYKNNRKKVLERIRHRYTNDIDGAFTRKSELARKRWKDTRIGLFDTLGGAFCKKCGYKDWRGLQIDHINGGGSRHIKSFTNYHKYHQYIREHIEEFQVLCANCNRIKVHENQEVIKRVSLR